MIFTLDNLFHALVAVAATSLAFYMTGFLYPFSWIAWPVIVAAFYIREAAQKDFIFYDWRTKKHMEWVVPAVVSFITGGIWSWFLA